MAKVDQNAGSAGLAVTQQGTRRAIVQHDAQAALLLAAADLSLSLAHDGTIVELVVSTPDLVADGAEAWRGRKLGELVTIESKPKIAELLAEAAAGGAPRWRQVNHPTPGGEVPIRYACVAAGDHLIAIGRDLRATAAIQQRLLQTQQALERDYLKLRHAESRYRLMFDVSDEAIVIVDAATRRITEANPAAHRLLGLAEGALPRQPATAIVAQDARDDLIALLGAAAAGGGATRTLMLRKGSDAEIVATPFRQERATFLLLRLGIADAEIDGGDGRVLRDAVERMPDAFVLTDGASRIVTTNAAFVSLAQAASPEAMVGAPLDRWLGRPGVDLELVAAELRKTGAVRNVATIVRGGLGGQEEVEMSAVMIESDGAQHIGFVIRSVARRLRDLLPAERDLPRSVEQLTNLVGRMSLREIVRESSDLIERLCIEAALTHTSDNRASAAEILGLSRQGLYSKLHRHGLGNLVDDKE